MSNLLEKVKDVMKHTKKVEDLVDGINDFNKGTTGKTISLSFFRDANI